MSHIPLVTRLGLCISLSFYRQLTGSEITLGASGDCCPYADRIHWYVTLQCNHNHDRSNLFMLLYIDDTHSKHTQDIPWNMYKVFFFFFALFSFCLCCSSNRCMWFISLYSSGLHHWQLGSHLVTPVSVKQSLILIQYRDHLTSIGNPTVEMRWLYVKLPYLENGNSLTGKTDATWTHQSIRKCKLCK